MFKKNLLGVCTKCGDPANTSHLLKTRCRKKGCKGFYEPRVNIGDQKECNNCEGRGYINDIECNICKGSGKIDNRNNYL